MENNIMIEETKDTKVIAAYWGTGKKTFMEALPTLCSIANAEITAVNLIPTLYHYLPDKKNNNSKIPAFNPEYPKNYVRAIMEYIGRVDYIFVGTTDDIQSAMWMNDIEYTLIYPEPDLIDEYVGRFILNIYDNDKSPKKNQANFNSVGRMIRMWKSEIPQFEKDRTHANKIITLGRGEFLTDALLDIHLTPQELNDIKRDAIRLQTGNFNVK